MFLLNRKRTLIVQVITLIALSGLGKQFLGQQIGDDGGVDSGGPMGAVPGIPFQSNGIENVNPKTGNLNITIPLLTIKSAGKADTQLILSYNSNGNWANGIEQNDPLIMTQSLFQLCTPRGAVGNFVAGTAEYGIVGNPYYVMVGCDGTVHDSLEPTPQIINGVKWVTTADGSFITQAVGNATARYPDGFTTSDNLDVTDNNGNQEYGFGGIEIDNDQQYYLPEHLHYVDETGAPQQITLSYIPAKFAYPGSTGRESEQNQFEVLDKVTYPDGTFYHFSWVTNSDGTLTGQIRRIDYPLGGYTRFTYYGETLYTDPTYYHGLSDRYYAADGLGENHYHYTTTYPYCADGSFCAAASITYPTGDVETMQWQGKSPNMPYQDTLTDASGHVLKSTSRTFVDLIVADGVPLLSLPQTETVAQDGITQYTKHYQYDSYGNVTQDQKMSSAGTVLSETDTAYYGATHPEYTAPNINLVQLPEMVIKTGVGGNQEITTYAYDEDGLGLRGNVTTITKGLSGPSGPSWHMTHDTRGNILTATDPRGNSTTYGYTDSWTTSGDSDSCGSISGALPTSVINAKGQTTLLTYYRCTGMVASVRDPNDVSNGRNGTVYHYNASNALTSIDYPDLGHQSITYGFGLAPEYDSNNADSPPSYVVETTTSATPNPDIVTRKAYDGSGRLVATLNADGLVTERSYDMMGRVSYTYQPGGSMTFYQYDALSRPIKESIGDGSVQWTCYGGIQTGGQPNCRSRITGTAETTSWVDQSDWTGSGSTVTSWQRDMNGLGRLSYVVEPNGAITNYGYDGLGNLLSINQPGLTGETARNRSFSYDSLSRMIAATNPESETTTYSYLVGSSLCAGDVTLPCSKTDARHVTTNYQYDVLDRLTFKRYTDGTQTEGFGYDGKDTNGDTVGQPSLNSIGRLSHTSNGINAAATYSYDAMGRIRLQTEYDLSSCSYNVSVAANYDAAGNMMDLTYPDGHHIGQTFDNVGRLITSNLIDINGVSASQSYLESATYFRDGSPHVLTLGNGIQQTITKNGRGQVQNLLVSTPLPPYNGQPFLSHTYCYMNCATGGPVDNGNIWGITDTLKSANTQGFTYDTLNRINQFWLGGTLNQQYAIDSFGNLSGVTNGIATTTFDSDNRIGNLPCASSMLPYDADGNQLCSSDPNGAVDVYTYDGAKRISQIAMLNSEGMPFVSYVYDANGTRVRKSNADGTYTEYVDFNGQPMAEKDQSGHWTDYIYANGQKIARASSSDTRYHLTGVNGETSDSGRWTVGTLPIPSNLIVRDGDILNFRMYQHNAVSGISMGFTDNSNSDWYCGPCRQPLGQADQWVNQSIPLSGPMTGKTLSYFFLGDFQGGPDGEFDVMIGDISIVHTDGTVDSIPVQSGSFSWGGDTTAVTNGGFAGEQVDLNSGQPGVVAQTHYYVADHLGSTQMEFTAGGWPVWAGQFAPFGQELDTGSTSMHYKFTGKERDSESGNDYFGARYYGSSMGRFLSPDDDSGEHADQPQSWNLYSYVQNNPVTNTDPDGHDCIDTSNFATDGTVTVTRGDSCASSLGPNGTYVNGTIDANSITATVSGSGTSFGYNFTSYDGQSGGAGVIAQAPPYGPLEGPANLAGANMIGNGGMAAINEFVKQSLIGAAFEGAGQAIGMGVDALRAARAAKAAEALAVAERVTQHAYLKHAGEFGNISRNEFQSLVQETMANPSEVRSLSNGRTAYWSDSQQMVVIENGTAPSQSTAFRPTAGRAYFDNMR